MNLLDLAWLNWFLYFGVLIKVANFYREVINPHFLITGGLLYFFSFISHVSGAPNEDIVQNHLT